MRTLIFISLGLLLAGCPELPEGRFQCANDTQCPGSMRCNLADNRCYSVLPDAGMSDASDGAVSDASDGDVGDAEAGVEVVTPIVTTCTLQGDSGSRTFAIAQIAIPTKPNPEAPLPVAGFDVDGLTSTATDLSGCRKTDLTGGLDNGYGSVHAGLGGVLSQAGIDLNLGLQKAIVDDIVDLELVIGDWDLTQSDSCVTVTLQGDVSGSAITTLVGRAPLVNGLVDVVSLGGAVPVVSTFDLPADGGLGGCTSNCVVATTHMVVQGAVARLRLSGDLLSLVASSTPNDSNSSMLGGYALWTGTGTPAFAPSFIALIEAIDPALAPTINNIFGQFLDLDSTPALNACTPVGNGTSADSFSVGLLISSTPP